VQAGRKIGEEVSRSSSPSKRRNCPSSVIDAVLKIVPPGPDDPDALYSYSLEYAQATEIMGTTKIRRGERRLDYYLESRQPSAARNELAS
jgi:hypothetical protein